MMGISLGGWLIGVALLVLGIAVIAAPLVRERGGKGRAASLPTASEEAPSPAARRRQILVALRDLEFDYATGKVSEEDYRVLRARLLQEAAAWVPSETPPPDGKDRTPETDDLDALIEQAVQAKRARHCTRCHYPVRPTDKFCAMCGQRLGEVA